MKAETKQKIIEWNARNILINRNSLLSSYKFTEGTREDLVCISRMNPTSVDSYNTLIVPSFIEHIEDCAFSDVDVTKLVLNGTKIIGICAFQGSNIKELSIKGADTILTGAFMVNKFRRVIVEANNLSADSFSLNHELEEITIKSHSLYIDGIPFRDCGSLERIVFDCREVLIKAPVYDQDGVIFDFSGVKRVRMKHMPVGFFGTVYASFYIKVNNTNKTSILQQLRGLYGDLEITEEEENMFYVKAYKK